MVYGDRLFGLFKSTQWTNAWSASQKFIQSFVSRHIICSVSPKPINARKECVDNIRS